MLLAAASVPQVAGQTLDIGGPQTLTYEEIVQRIAELMLLRRATFGLRASLTPLTGRLVAALTGEDPELIVPLMESLSVICWSPTTMPPSDWVLALLRRRRRARPARMGGGRTAGRKMSIVTASTHIEAPPERVWETVMDPRLLGEWVTIHRGLRQAYEGPPRVGCRMDQQIHLRGVTLDVHWRLVECRPCELALWEGRGPARSRARTEYALRPDGAGTRFDYRNELRAPLGPIGALASRALVGGMPERGAGHTLERLRDLFADGRQK
jgi:uncharacterized protein YndB with AHSA1/START domain